MSVMGQDRSLESVRKALSHLHEKLGLDFSFQLWDGSLVPPSDNEKNKLRLALTDRTVLTKLLRRPKLKTVIESLSVGWA